MPASMLSISGCLRSRKRMGGNLLLDGSMDGLAGLLLFQDHSQHVLGRGQHYLIPDGSPLLAVRRVCCGIGWSRGRA